VFLSRSEAVAAILWDVAQYHPEHLDAVCECAKIGESRRYELLQIGGGRKTIAQSRQDTAARQQKFKAKKKKAKQLAAAEAAKADSVTTPKVTEKATAKRSKAGMDKPDKPKKAATARPEKAPAPSKSEKALVEFKVACDRWLPHLTECDKLRAVNYVQVRTGAIPETELMAA
jgi:ATPase subunit of ABC transporter with duplicated ATPase domains